MRQNGFTKTSISLLALSLVGCDGLVTTNKSSSLGTTLQIQGGLAVTPDPVLKIQLSAPSNITKMKVGFDKLCGDGSWTDFDSNFKVMSNKVNESVSVSAQVMSDDGLVSDCMVGEIIHDNPGTPEICETYPAVCDRTPQVLTPGVVTILLALGDQLDQQLVVNGTSAQVIAETAMRFATPLHEPRILVVRDSRNMGESYQDTEYIAQELLKLYQSVTLIDEPTGGLGLTATLGYDLIWFNNPGYPMGSSISRNTLLAFQGGVILSGDDMTWGNGFSMESLTGLRHIDNGVNVVCNGTSYPHNDNYGNQYRVSMDQSLLTIFPDSVLNFRYGNDIDNSVVVASDLQVISWAQGGPSACTEKRPVIARYHKGSSIFY